MNKEIWKFIEGFDMYEISNYGNIRSYYNSSNGVRDSPKKIIPYFIKRSCGYENLGVTLYKNMKPHKLLMHRLVASAFIPNPLNKPEINHIDGNPKNNHYSNLEWCTHAENMQHAVDTGLLNNRGERCGTSKLKQDDINDIFAMRKSNVKVSHIAEKFDVCKSHVYRILRKEYWHYENAKT